MDPMSDNQRLDGIRAIERNFAAFRGLSATAQQHFAAGRLGAAAAYVEIAALFALSNHCGLFASADLENLALRIGRAAVPGQDEPRRTGASPARILHVATAVTSIGGLSRMIWRWVRQDRTRSHSVALTRQRHPVPAELQQAVDASGGRIHRVNATIGGVLTWARRLRDLAADADIVVLHVGNRDIVPVLAFADPVGRPKTIYIDHADHLFWLGVGIADVVAGLRGSGALLARRRRGIEPGRQALLPIILAPPARSVGRAEAKRRLGLDPEATMLLSVARAVKFRSIGGTSYAEAHLPFLRQRPDASLVVVGAGPRPDWADAIDAAGGHIVLHGERPDTALFYQAADIYVDSFPFVSTTSLLEAGSYETPLVTRFPYGEASGILGADMPGLAGTLIQTRSIEDYTAALLRLAGDPALRRDLGAATRAGIVRQHTGTGWQAEVERLYAQALASRDPPRCTAVDRPAFGEPDVLMHLVHDHPVPADALVLSQLSLMPPDLRLRLWLRLLGLGGGTANRVRDAVRCWLPEWLLVHLR